MELKEAIAHLDEVLADDNRWNGCEECKQEHIQLRDWLKELERWRTTTVNEKIKNPFAMHSTLICHNCDHKDEYIEELEASQVDWIMVSDRLPTREEYLKNDGRFIGCDGNRVYQANFDIYRNIFVRDCFGCINEEDKCIIKWKPMPEI